MMRVEAIEWLGHDWRLWGAVLAVLLIGALCPQAVHTAWALLRLCWAVLVAVLTVTAWIADLLTSVLQAI